MPCAALQTLSLDDVYAVTASLPNANDIVGTGTVFGAFSLPAVRMPNRNDFAADRPDAD